MTETTARRDVPAHRYTAALAGQIEQRWQDYWAEHGTYHAPNPVGPLAEGAGPRGQAVRAGHVPVPVRRGPARRPPAGLHRHRRVRPVPPDDRPQRAAHDGLRRLRPARRAVRGADRAAPAQDHRGEHRDLPAADPQAGPGPRRAPPDRHDRPRVLPLDAVDLPADLQLLVRRRSRARRGRSSSWRPSSRRTSAARRTAAAGAS